MRIEFVALGSEDGAGAAIAALVHENTPLGGAAASLNVTTGGARKRAVDGGRFTGA